MPANDVEAARHDPKLANVLYHDFEAEQYDDKWSISYDERCIAYARDRFVKVAGTDGWPFERVLEVSCGTGFFLLNLMQAGVAERGWVTDISPGMVAVALRNAKQLGLDVAGEVADAEGLPFPDESFDLVVGHAVLHHIPDVEASLREVLRVLRPGGRFVFAGEPTKWGDLVARRLSRATWTVATRVSHLPPFASRWARPRDELRASSDAAALEALVDLHTFRPDALARMAIAAGAVDVAVRTEELTASWFGWPARTLEYAVNPDRLGLRWKLFAYGAWQRLTAIDAKLARVVPAGIYYNALLTGVRPERSPEL